MHKMVKYDSMPSKSVIHLRALDGLGEVGGLHALKVLPVGAHIVAHLRST